MEQAENICKCGSFKRKSDNEKALEKDNAILQQRICLLENQLKELRENDENIKETYEKSLSLLSLKDTQREESKIKERLVYLEQMTELRNEHDSVLKKKDVEVEKLK